MNYCVDCKHFSHGIPTYNDPIPDTGCRLHNDFTEADDSCKNFEEKISEDFIQE